MTDPIAPSNLRYVDADRLDRSVVDLDGLDVRAAGGDAIGEVDGFLVDASSGRPRYIVVDSGGWFRSGRFLLPIDQASLDESRRSLRVNLDRDIINRFPEIDLERVERLDAATLDRYDEGVRACCPDDADLQRMEYESEGAAPVWWDTTAYTAAYVPGAPSVSARVPAEGSAPEASEHYGDGELRVPRVGERAQPGDVIGIESGGERTGIGDTAEDEDRRRERAEREVRSMDIEPNEDLRRSTDQSVRTDRND